MNRTELIGEVSKQTGLTTRQAESGLKAFENVVTSALRSNDTVRITGFGSFKSRDRAARRGRNPQTGAPVRIKASKGVGFAAGAGLKKDLNSRTPLEKPDWVGPSANAVKAVTARKAAPAKKAPAKKAPAKKAPAKKAVVKKAVVKKAPAKKAPAKKAPAKKAPAKKAPAKKAPAKRAGR